MKKLFLASHNPDIVPQKSQATLELIPGGRAHEVETPRFPAQNVVCNIRSEFIGPNGQSVRLVEMAGYLMVQKLVEFGHGENTIEWEVKDLLPDSKENQSKLMVVFGQLVQEACVEKMDASA